MVGKVAKPFLPHPTIHLPSFPPRANGKGWGSSRNLATAWVWLVVGRIIFTSFCLTNHSDCHWVGESWAGVPTDLGGIPDQLLPRTCHLYSGQGLPQSPVFWAKLLRFCLSSLPSKGLGREGWSLGQEGWGTHSPHQAEQ